MRKILLLTVLLLPVIASAQQRFQRQYGVATTVDFVLYNADGTLDVDEVDGGTEAACELDGGGASTCTNDFADEGSYYSLALTAGELTGQRVEITVTPTGPVEVLLIETYGSPSALHDRGGGVSVADQRFILPSDAMIVPSICLIDKVSGEKYTGATSEDSGLKIVLSGSDGVADATYDATTEIEDITTIGTWAAPSANNVRFEVEPATNCYQLMFAANLLDDTFFSTNLHATITIEDTSNPAFDATVVRLVGVTTEAQFEQDVVDGINSSDLPNTTYLDGRTLPAATYPTDTELSAVQTGVDTANAEITNLQTEIGNNGDALTDIPTDAVLSIQRIITGTCDSGTTTSCVDNALTQANESQLDDRLICFDDHWCARITGFNPTTDTLTTTKIAPSSRSSLAYTIFPATAQ